MTRSATWTFAVVAFAIAASVQSFSQSGRESAWNARTPWGDPDLQGEWTTEGEYGVPLERPTQFGTRQFLTDAEYAKRLEDVRLRDERDLTRVDVFSGKAFNLEEYWDQSLFDKFNRAYHHTYREMHQFLVENGADTKMQPVMRQTEYRQLQAA